MVKNACGGKKTKGFARKNMMGINGLRISECEDEIYVQVTKMLGNSMCNVVSLDGEELLCHIRGKFSGRGKRDNLIATTTWLLVGLRQWETKETRTKGKLLNCDVLTVYNDNDKLKLKNSVININWSSFIATDTKIHGMKESCSDENPDDAFVFMDEKAQEYQDLIETQLNMSSNTQIEDTADGADGDEINIDDI